MVEHSGINETFQAYKNQLEIQVHTENKVWEMNTIKRMRVRERDEKKK